MTRPTGGLTAAIDPAERAVGGSWIAGSGSADGAVADGHAAVPPGDPQYDLPRV